MTFVAFLRNMNLGHPGSPTRAELEDAFGGPSVAQTFQTNGTVVFRGIDRAETARLARGRLAAAGYHHHCVVRRLDEVAKIVMTVPPLPPDSDVYRLVVSFFDLDAEHPIPVPPLRNRDGLVEVRSIDSSHAVSACWKPGGSAGDVTGFVEQLVGVLVTTRTLATLARLVARSNSVER